MSTSSWTVFFMFKPFTTINTTILTKRDDVKDDELIAMAKEKIKIEMGVSIDELSKKIGVNDNFGSGWIMVEHNDVVATAEELENIEVHD